MTMDLFDFFTVFLFFAIPAGAIAFFVASLILLTKAEKANAKNPGTFTDAQIRNRKIMLAVSSLIALVMVSVIIAYIALMFLAIAFM